MIDNRREQLLEIVKKEFIGPDPIDWPGYKQENGEEILISDPPRTRYIAGILYPRETVVEIADDFSDKEDGDFISEKGQEEDDASEEENLNVSGEYLEEAEELINRSNAYEQSAMSITSAVRENDQLWIEVSAGKYVTKSIPDPANKTINNRYLRVPVFWSSDGFNISLPSALEGIKNIEIPDTNLQLDITYRYRKGDSCIYTFTLENTFVTNGSYRDDDCYFQVEFTLKSNVGFLPLPDTEKINAKDEDYLSNQLLYRDSKNFAIGHGCAADWDESEKVTWIKTSVFPSYEVKAIMPTTIEGVTLEMLRYGPNGDFTDSINELKLMCTKYESWIKEKEGESKILNERYNRTDYEKTAKRHISNCKECLKRMRDGIHLLETNETVKIAFQYMNLAMIMQQLHYNLPLQKWGCDEEDNVYFESLVKQLPDPEDRNTWYGNKERYGKWRPFQLAFVLMNLRAMLDKECSERRVVDLIWFPTGGGKTEAYLGLSAYTIFLRRYLNKEDSGTAILMRYTLRLLTAQQYERASSMICACETIRKEHEDLFGKRRISIGLWVGSATTPNYMKDAVKAYNELKNGKSDENPFVILKCPWCGAQMGFIQKKNGTRDVKGYFKKIEGRGKQSIIYKCSNEMCSYSSKDNPLPLHIVDEDIYESTPTLLLGTVDKFAMLPFRPDAKRLFGYYDDEKLTAPDLIIQDELHLISGPLGSMVGHYETMINELCAMKDGRKTIYPKIIASTATISRAKEQCHALYGVAPENVFQFPPSGLDASDSFFAREAKDKNGRQYVGILASGATSDATTAIRLFASLLYATKEIDVASEGMRDPYWTNVGYFNSIRELGQARTWVRADIDQHLDVIYKRRMYDKVFEKEDYKQKRRYIYRDEELTSRIPGDKVTASLANLNIGYTENTFKDKTTEDLPIDICVATNMISVGLDVSRLGLMTVAGQPKTTSEYIQATSRVGRNASEAPGIVFVLYRPGRPRDKSHYEHFKEYHSKLYCSVEPTSVTPFSSPVRDRALHAIIFGLIRLENGNSLNSEKPSYPSDEQIEYVKNVVRQRIEAIDSNELEETMDKFDEIINDWKIWNPSVWEPKKNRDWSFTNDVPLMYSSGEHPNEAWAERGFKTPTSMRSVDSSCEATLMLHEYSAKED